MMVEPSQKDIASKIQVMVPGIQPTGAIGYAALRVFSSSKRDLARLTVMENVLLRARETGELTGRFDAEEFEVIGRALLDAMKAASREDRGLWVPLMRAMRLLCKDMPEADRIRRLLSERGAHLRKIVPIRH